MINFLQKIIDFLIKIKSSLEEKQHNDALPKWYQIAIKELGVHEIAGIENNKRILEYHFSTLLKATTDEVGWCSSFVCWCLEQAGIESTRNALARSYLSWGKEIIEPYEGCIVVFKRGIDPQSGHVAFFIGFDEQYIKCLGGNINDMVCISKLLKSNLLGFREPNISPV